MTYMEAVTPTTCEHTQGFRTCVEAAGHEAHGLTHIASDGVEWAAEDQRLGYVPTRCPAEMALAS